MKIVLAFDSFKGCITAAEACKAAAEAILEIDPKAEVIECPLSDGGEGLVDCVGKILPINQVCVQTHDPLMQLIEAQYALSPDGKTAYMEMAATSGLPLVPFHRRNPMLTTTYGVGDFIHDAAQRGVKQIIMGIGGSATCDGGKGMIQSLLDHGYTLPSCDLPQITVACDVTNPLYGEKGAAYIFAPQKGATPEQVKLLDEALQVFARDTEKAGLASSNLAQYPGTGAAGGLGYGLMAYLKAELKSGMDIILGITDFKTLIQDADFVLTGEGKSDEQTLMGKVPDGVLKQCKLQNIPTLLLSGCIDDPSHNLSAHFTTVKSINENDSRPLEVLLNPSVAKANLKKTVKEIL